MHLWTDTILVLLVLTNMMLLGSSQLGSCVRLVAIQGILLGLLTMLVQAHDLTARVVFLALGSAILKGGVVPWLLRRALREAEVRREIEPFVGFSLSLAVGLLCLGGSLWLGSRLPVPSQGRSSLVFPLALFSILAGLFLIVGRRKALTQVIGYLVLENGIYVFGIALVGEIPMLVELGVLLDVFVAVFVMGIAIYHINREFEHIDIDRLKTLKG